ncbi:hypothetical protein GUJ93_ZPchr0372g33720 [Zizania palustris]|uniref:Secreted protein n=1 Tax=Zizania palustris TaxID=103762 RepID=A0A8J5W5J4_ZIZPA|nr:hypothetical protein GUJ93_ZPchr0372g33720 [Zizania palustris]
MMLERTTMWLQCLRMTSIILVRLTLSPMPALTCKTLHRQVEALLPESPAIRGQHPSPAMGTSPLPSVKLIPKVTHPLSSTMFTGH